ncbi:MAG: hypothetical protein WCO56_00895 [Verrucomicrobiota bacterium]
MKRDHDKSEGEIHWIIPGVLATSERPGYPGITVKPTAVDRWLEEVRRQRIRSVINLLSDDEMTVYYRQLGQPLAHYYTDAGLAVRQVAQEDLGVAVPSHVLLDRVKTAFASLPKPVLIHCSAGTERSKIAVAAICRVWKRQARQRF